MMGVRKRDLRNGSIPIKDFESFNPKRQLKKKKKVGRHGSALLAVGPLLPPQTPQKISIRNAAIALQMTPGSCHVPQQLVRS